MHAALAKRASDLCLTRVSAVPGLAMAIVIPFCSLLAPVPARAQSDQGAPQDAGPSRQLTIAPREVLETAVCEGGTVTGGKCTCPAEFKFLPAAFGTGGSCVRSNAENCRGGDLTAAGICLCSG